MKRKEIKIKMEVSYNGRTSVVEKIKGNKAKVRPYGESSMWRNISDLEKCDAN